MWSATSKAEMFNWIAFNGCKWVFLHCNAWHPIFPCRRKHVDPIESLSYCFYSYDYVMSVFLFVLSTCLAHFDHVKIKKKKTTRYMALILPHSLNFDTPLVLDDTTSLYPVSENSVNYLFPLCPLYSNGLGPFLFFSHLQTRHKVIKS